tara:strand:- start:733 stop:906 length:174 start_codon:yes stop_codon:yes gene_type:complete
MRAFAVILQWANLPRVLRTSRLASLVSIRTQILLCGRNFPTLRMGKEFNKNQFVIIN